MLRPARISRFLAHQFEYRQLYAAAGAALHRCHCSAPAMPQSLPPAMCSPPPHPAHCPNTHSSGQKVHARVPFVRSRGVWVTSVVHPDQPAIGLHAFRCSREICEVHHDTYHTCISKTALRISSSSTCTVDTPVVLGSAADGQTTRHLLLCPPLAPLACALWLVHRATTVAGSAASVYRTPAPLPSFRSTFPSLPCLLKYIPPDVVQGKPPACPFCTGTLPASLTGPRSNGCALCTPPPSPPPEILWIAC